MRSSEARTSPDLQDDIHAPRDQHVRLSPSVPLHIQAVTDEHSSVGSSIAKSNPVHAAERLQTLLGSLKDKETQILVRTTRSLDTTITSVSVLSDVFCKLNVRNNKHDIVMASLAEMRSENPQLRQNVAELRAGHETLHNTVENSFSELRRAISVLQAGRDKLHDIVMTNPRHSEAINTGTRADAHDAAGTRPPMQHDIQNSVLGAPTSENLSATGADGHVIAHTCSNTPPPLQDTICSPIDKSPVRFMAGTDCVHPSAVPERVRQSVLDFLRIHTQMVHGKQVLTVHPGCVLQRGRRRATTWKSSTGDNSYACDDCVHNGRACVRKANDGWEVRSYFGELPWKWMG